MSEFTLIDPVLTTYEWSDRPSLGMTATTNPHNSSQTTPGQEITLGGFSGLYYEGKAANGNLKFITNTDRGPNGEPTDLIPSIPGSERPFALPNFQPELVRFELDRTTGQITITERIGLKRPDGLALTGLPNLQSGAVGTAYTDEVAIDLFGNRLTNDPLGADLEGIVVAADGTFWMVDEYRPAIYHFDATGQLVDRFIPKGTPTGGGEFGTAALPEVYAQRRNNRGFEAVALEGTKLYMFIQSAIDNPDSAADTTSRGSQNLRILEFDVTTQAVTGEYLYRLDDISGSGTARTDKIGDAVAVGDGKFLVVERDDQSGSDANKLIYEIDLKGATNINSAANLTKIPVGKTIEQLSPTELQNANLQTVSKRLVTNAATLGYTGVEKLEGLAVTDSGAIVLLNDNDFGLQANPAKGDGTVSLNDEPTPVKLGIIEPGRAIDTSLNPSDFNPGNLEPLTLPNQVASGDTTQSSTVLWTRSEVAGTVKFEYSTYSDFSQIAGTQTVTVTNPLQPVKVQVDGLMPNTPYYYRATDAAGAIGVGQFNTTAEVGTRTGLRFGAAGDWRGELSPYPAIANADQQNLAFFISLGDTIYADFPSPALNKPQAETLEEYRLKHNEVYSQRNGLNTWGDLRSSTSILAVIDDHEVINDFAGGALASSDPRLKDVTPGKLVNDTALYENGLQTFQEYNPIRDEFYGETGDARTAGERKLYRYNTYGNDAASFVLDARSFRDTELEGVTNPANASQVTNFLVQSYNPARTLLGRQQVADLKKDLLNAEQQGITWKYIVVPEPIQNLGIVAASDRFEGYAAERTEILKFINDNDISNVVFISADIHSTLVNNLTYQTAPGQAQIATSAFEITTGSVGFDAPFGPTVADLASGLGLLSAEQKAFYDLLPVTNDADSLLNDKDDFIKQLVNSQLQPFGYDPLGLNDNLAVAGGKINAKLLQGDYLSTQTYAWTQFDIDALTQKLTVTTYGIPYYTEAELNANPSEIASRTQTVVSQFEVQPAILGDAKDNELTGTSGADEIKGLGGNDTLLGLGGDDKLSGGEGDDLLRGGTGSNMLLGGSGSDRFAIGEGSDIIADFKVTEGDRIALINVSFAQLTLTQGTGSNAKDTLIQLASSNNLLGIVKGVEASTLTQSVFTIV